MNAKEQKIGSTNLKLNDVQRVAVAAAMGSTDTLAELKKGLAAGKYEGKIALLVDFEVNKAEDYETTPTANLMSKAVIALALVKMGKNTKAQAAFFEALEEAAMEALLPKLKKNGGPASDDVSQEVIDGNKKVADKIAELETKVLAKLPAAKRSGATKVTVKEVTRLAMTDIELQQKAA